MAIKYKGIYIMCANKENVSGAQLNNPVKQGLQFLVSNNKFFNLLWFQARAEGPQFFETQQIQQPNQSNEDTVTNFREWLLQSGITVEEKRWDSYFFQTTIPIPDLNTSDWKIYFLVYFHTTGADVLEPSRFIVDYTMAGKEANISALTQLLNATVSCPACEKVVDPVVRASDKGFLTCPFCGQFWTKPQ
jgi:hypothetical protein